MDVIVLALGVNDVLRFQASTRWSRQSDAVNPDLRRRVGAAPVVLASVPPMGQFPALPQPLSGLWGCGRPPWISRRNGVFQPWLASRTARRTSMLPGACFVPIGFILQSTGIAGGDQDRQVRSLALLSAS